MDKDGKTVKCHMTREEAEAHMKKLREAEPMMKMGATTFLIDEFVTTRPGEPYRLFPFGRVVKNGKVHFITPEYAAKFSLPHFKPPIKLGSHKEETPAGGHIIGLEVRPDGLYAIPAHNDKGQAAVQEGHYRYQSPEVIWDDGYLEHPTTGERIQGPLIVGDALLHMPHLGEAAALYSVEISRGDNMETVTIPTSMWDKFMAWVGREDKPPTNTPPDDYSAVREKAAKVDTLEAEIATMKAEQAKQARLSRFAAEVGKTKVAQPGMAELLAGMTDEQAAAVLQQFNALSAQIDESALLGEKGVTGGGPVVNDPAQALNAAVQAKMKEAKVDYNAALAIVATEQPDLFRAYTGGK